MDALVQRLVQNPHDEEAITYAHHQGQQDPRSYAMLLERVGRTTGDALFACHWLTEAANVWATTLGDAHRAARALMTAIDRDPTQAAPAEKLADLYREKGDNKALVALLERRTKALAPLTAQDPDMAAYVAAMHEELARLWAEPPLAQAKKAIENYRRAIELQPGSQYSIYALRELYKSQEQWLEAIPLFAMEQALTDDPERQVALYSDEAEVRKQAGDGAGSSMSLRHAWSVDQGRDPALRQALASSVLDRVQAGENVGDDERYEAAGLFNQLAEEYGGEYGVSYSVCALEIEPGDDRAIQLAMFYGGQEGRDAEIRPRAAKYLTVNPNGAMAGECQAYIGDADVRSLAAQVPAPGAQAAESEPRMQQSAPVAASAGKSSRRLEVADEVSAVMEEEPESDDFAPAADPDRVRTLIDEAEALARKGRKSEAGAKYREAVALDPGNEEALNFLQTHLRQTRKYAELRDILLAATRSVGVTQDAKRNWLREIAGLCETQLRDLDTAIHALQQLVSLDPGEGPRAQLKRLLERAGRWDDVATLLEQEAEQAPDIEVRISLEKNLAKLHEHKRKDVVAAGDAWARIASLTPEDDSALMTAVKFYEKGERLDLAADAIAANVGALEDEDAKGQLLSRLGQLRRDGGDMLAAGDAFAEGAALTQKAEMWADAEQCFAAAEAWDQAAQAVDEQAQLAAEPKQQATLYARESDLLSRAGDDSSAVLRLEQATDLDPTNEEFAKALEERFESADRFPDLAAFLLRRADKLESAEMRIELRKRAATIQRDTLGDPEAARESLQQLLVDGDDEEALLFLADDAGERGEAAEAVEYLAKLKRVIDDPARKAEVMLREARLLAETLEDVDAAIDCYQEVLSSVDATNAEALTAIADLEEGRGNLGAAAAALEKYLEAAAEPGLKLELAQRLTGLYEGELDDPKSAVRVLDIVVSIEEEDFDAIGRLVALNERLEDWPRVARHLQQLIEVEGDEEELSEMTRRLATVLHEKCERGDDALAALVEVADQGDAACRDAYVELGDQLGWKGVVAQKLVEWFAEAPVGAARNDALRNAFNRFVEVGRDADAAGVAKELARTRGADAEMATQLEELGVKLKDLDALGVAHDLLSSDLSGPSRAEELVRQAEVLKQAGVSAEDALQHGEQALASVGPEDAEDLLGRLVSLADEPKQIVDLYERQVSRCKAPQDRLRALARAAQVAAEQGAPERARGFFDLALSGGVQEESLDSLENVARDADEAAGTEQVRRLLATAMAGGGGGSRDGGRTRSALLRRAANIAMRELSDAEQALAWLKDSLVAHVDDGVLDDLEALANELGEPKRADAVLSTALTEVFDGPLVRKLLARRAALRRDQLEDSRGAAEDLKRLHDLSPSDQAVMDDLAKLYKELEDWRGMVQLYEDQILRGKDPASRAELARKVARLWEERLGDAREAADAWRRVLRMKKEDPEATEGLDRAKKGMLNTIKSEDKPAPKPKSEAAPPPASAPASAAPPASPPAAAPAVMETSSADELLDLPPAHSSVDAIEDEVTSVSKPEHEPPASSATLAADDDDDDDDQPTAPPQISEAQAVEQAEDQLRALRPKRPDISFGGADDESTMSAELLGDAAAPAALDYADAPSDATEVRPGLLTENQDDDDDDDAMVVDEDALLVDEDELLME
ncbi:MAG: hypothetical protein H6716_17655 [Polyangiaceae bacterium]|nr:hypothetical protein [Polyangiaceae bacterium]